MKKKCRGKEKKNENKRNAFSLQEAETDRELSYISPALW